jgi:hypothetical protein
LRNSAVIAGENDDGAVSNAGFVYRIKYLADVGIHLRQHVRPLAVAGLSGEGRVAQAGQVRLGKRHVRKEWSVSQL